MGAERKAGERVGSPAHLQGGSGSVCLLVPDPIAAGVQQGVALTTGV